MNARPDKPLARSISLDVNRPVNERWHVTEEYMTGYYVIGKFRTRAEARRFLKEQTDAAENQ